MPKILYSSVFRRSAFIGLSHQAFNLQHPHFSDEFLLRLTGSVTSPGVKCLALADLSGMITNLKIQCLPFVCDCGINALPQQWMSLPYTIHPMVLQYWLIVPCSLHFCLQLMPPMSLKYSVHLIPHEGSNANQCTIIIAI